MEDGKVEEDKKILKFIIENKRYGETSGIALWKLMEDGKEILKFIIENKRYGETSGIALWKLMETGKL